MIRNWTLHLKTDEEKERFKREILSARGVLERLGEILKTEEDDIHSKERNTKVYALPNWDYIQAHYNGYVDCLKHIQFLINLDQQENDRLISGQRPAQHPRRTDEQVEGQATSGTLGS